MRVLGLDISTKIGWAFRSSDNDDLTFDTIKSTQTGYARIQTLVTRLWSVLIHADPDLVVIEGYAFGAKGNSLSKLIEVGAVVRWELTTAEMGATQWIDVAPSTVKKFWTGKGNASKEDMLFAAWDRFEDRMTDDEADATALAEFGLALGGHGLEGLSKERLSAVTQWQKTHADFKIET